VTITNNVSHHRVLAALAEIADRSLLSDDMGVPKVCTGRIVGTRRRRVTLRLDDPRSPTSAWCHSRDLQIMAKQVSPTERVAMIIFEQSRKPPMLCALRRLPS
jgi:hypothetical protein